MFRVHVAWVRFTEEVSEVLSARILGQAFFEVSGVGEVIGLLCLRQFKFLVIC